MMIKNNKDVVNKIRVSLFMMVFFFALVLTNVKPNLNYATANELDFGIRGIGELKAQQIIKEKNENGIFKNKEDFYTRVVYNDKYKVGETVAKRITNKYKIGE